MKSFKRFTIGFCILLVAGLFSVAVATKTAVDPLDKEMTALEKEADDVLVDPSHAANTELAKKEGTRDRRVYLVEKNLVQLIADMHAMQAKIEEETPKRSSAVQKIINKETAKVSAYAEKHAFNQKMLQHLEAVSVETMNRIFTPFSGVVTRYFTIQNRLVLNYLKNVHMTDLDKEEPKSAYGFRKATAAEKAARQKLAHPAMMNGKPVLDKNGKPVMIAPPVRDQVLELQARDYSTQGQRLFQFMHNGKVSYDHTYGKDLDLRFDVPFGLYLARHKTLKLKYNIWHAPAEANGSYEKLELGLTPQDRIDREQMALLEQKDYKTYGKLVQFMVIHERLTNHWATQRMSPNASSHPVYLNSCGTGILSFEDHSVVGDAATDDMYSFLWKEDRYNEYDQIREALAPLTVNKTLMEDKDYAALAVKFFTSFDSYNKGVASSKEFNEGNDKAYNDYMAALPGRMHDKIETKWSSLASNALLDANLLADSWDNESVANRIVWIAYYTRVQLLANFIADEAAENGIKEVKADPKKAFNQAQALVDATLKTNAVAWKASLKADLIAELTSTEVAKAKLGFRENRFQEFVQGLLPDVQYAVNADLLKKKIEFLQQSLGETWLSQHKMIWNDMSKAYQFERGYIPVKGTLNHRMAAWTPDQLSQFFFRKLEAWAKTGKDDSDNDNHRDTNGVSSVAQNLMANQRVMNAIKGMFGELSTQFNEQLRAYKISPDQVKSGNTMMYSLLLPIAKKTYQEFQMSGYEKKARDKLDSKRSVVMLPTPTPFRKYPDFAAMAAKGYKGPTAKDMAEKKEINDDLSDFYEALSILNMTEVVTGKSKVVKASTGVLHDRVTSFYDLEMVLKEQQGVERELQDQIFKSLYDEQILAEILHDEAIGNNAFLGTRQTEDTDGLTLLDRITKAYTPKAELSLWQKAKRYFTASSEEIQANPDKKVAGSAPKKLSPQFAQLEAFHNKMNAIKTPVARPVAKPAPQKLSKKQISAIKKFVKTQTEAQDIAAYEEAQRQLGPMDKEIQVDPALVTALSREALHYSTIKDGTLISEACNANPNIPGNEDFKKVFIASKQYRSILNSLSPKYAEFEEKMGDAWTKTKLERLSDDINPYLQPLLFIMLAALIISCPIWGAGVLAVIAQGSFAAYGIATAAAVEAGTTSLFGISEGISAYIANSSLASFMVTSGASSYGLIMTKLLTAVFILQAGVMFETPYYHLSAQRRYALGVQNAQIGLFGHTPSTDADISFMTQNIHSQEASAWINGVMVLGMEAFSFKNEIVALINKTSREAIAESVVAEGNQELLSEITAKTKEDFIADQPEGKQTEREYKKAKLGNWKIFGRNMYLNLDATGAKIGQVSARNMASLLKTPKALRSFFMYLADDVKAFQIEQVTSADAELLYVKNHKYSMTTRMKNWVQSLAGEHLLKSGIWDAMIPESILRGGKPIDLMTYEEGGEYHTGTIEDAKEQNSFKNGTPSDALTDEIDEASNRQYSYRLKNGKKLTIAEKSPAQINALTKYILAASRERWLNFLESKDAIFKLMATSGKFEDREFVLNFLDSFNEHDWKTLREIYEASLRRNSKRLLGQFFAKYAAGTEEANAMRKILKNHDVLMGEVHKIEEVKNKQNVIDELEKKKYDKVVTVDDDNAIELESKLHTGPMYGPSVLRFLSAGAADATGDEAAAGEKSIHVEVNSDDFKTN